MNRNNLKHFSKNFDVKTIMCLTLFTLGQVFTAKIFLFGLSTLERTTKLKCFAFNN
jgi:hypothetical protein